MITYRVASHTPGRIRLSVPLIKKLTVADLKILSEIPLHAAVKNIQANPYTGSLTILYDSSSIDIKEYIHQFIADSRIESIIKKYRMSHHAE